MSKPIALLATVYLPAGQNLGGLYNIASSFKLFGGCWCLDAARYTQAILKFLKLNTQAQQREAVVQGRSLSPYRLRYKCYKNVG
jgi:hypothetical protein